jgi:hypothetical protein
LDKKRDWILWNREVQSIIGIGSEEDMKHQRDVLNTMHQTDAYIAQEFKENKGEN